MKRIISCVSSFQMEMSEDDINTEEYPTEIHDYLIAFEKSLGSVDEVLKTMMATSRSELLQKVIFLLTAFLLLVQEHLGIQTEIKRPVRLAAAQRNNKYDTSYPC